MGDRFVDVSYRGLEVGRQLKLREVTSDGAYVESASPMPVGSPLEVIIDDGTRLAVVVAQVHEVGGAAEAAGMRLRAVASDAASRRWWDSQPEPLARAAPALAGASIPGTPDAEVPVAAVAAPPVAPAPVDDAPVVVPDAIPVESATDVSSSGELEAVDAEDEGPSASASQTISTGSNGHGDAPRAKRKPSKRRKRNSRG